MLIYILFIVTSFGKTLFVKIHKMYKIHEIDICVHWTVSMYRLDGYSWHFVSEGFNKICSENWRLLKIWQKNGNFLRRQRLRWSRGSVLTFGTQVRGFKTDRSLRIFKGEKILSMPSFGGEIKPSVPCRRFAACRRSLNGAEVVISAKLPDNILVHSSTFRCWDLSRRGGLGGIWWRKLERLNVGDSNGKLPLIICPGCRVPEPYHTPDWALVSAQTGPRAGYL
jgi:hypothetical protein